MYSQELKVKSWGDICLTVFMETLFIIANR
jgi:hypothetical protein